MPVLGGVLLFQSQKIPPPPQKHISCKSTFAPHIRAEALPKIVYILLFEKTLLNTLQLKKKNIQQKRRTKACILPNKILIQGNETMTNVK